MKRRSANGKIRVVLAILGFCLVIGIAFAVSEQETSAVASGPTGKLEKMIVANGDVSMQVDLSKLNNARTRGTTNEPLRFEIEPDSFFKLLVFNDELRGPMPSSMDVKPANRPAVPSALAASYNKLMIESLPWGGQYELAVRDSETGFTFFNIEGHEWEYNPAGPSLAIKGGRLLVSPEFAQSLRKTALAGAIVGAINVDMNLRTVEMTSVVNGEETGTVLPAGFGMESNASLVPGPDVIVGDLSGLAQYGSQVGTQVGLAVGTDSCNAGSENLGWYQNPNNNHPVIPQNLYRMSANGDRFEQIGQSSVKHGFTALTNNLCGYGCNGVGGSQLGAGCSDPYSTSLNAGPNLGSRAWVNPFTGFYPRGDSATPNNNHTGHSHTSTSHRVLVEVNDLNTSMNSGAKYYAEGQYVTPSEYTWCQSHPGQCNMNNNVSYRQYSVSGTTSPFSFSPQGSTQRQKAAITAWTGATIQIVQPDPAADGIAMLGYKVTNPSAGVWHYEYAIYNQDLDRAIQSLTIPTGPGITLSNVGFHAPPQHPGWANDGTALNEGFSSAPWTQTMGDGTVTWGSETFLGNPNANAVRWGTLYNIRFDSNRPPQNGNAIIGFFKTGAPMTVPVQVPTPVALTSVSISGRLTNVLGQGIANAKVSLTTSGSSGARLFTTTSSFGYYSFENLTPGETYTIAPTSKRFTFTPWTGTVNDNMFNMDFIGVAIE
ncbi:MAG: carboxypeptidase regulatory-like domain-containing protein [Chloracidobacterium sp.]|nr:carboxypeptidase regulatory-like domain-containing protein [Chloracidobacterium sp.]MCC6825607.1 carboxypeptidase regulatory-like domain-containing protein [Acidobacteriota bacterium]MCO5334754.1 carboxypeptidase-like regulatory domain-containing protein [Pyrinomonadaceae bacterium]